MGFIMIPPLYKKLVITALFLSLLISAATAAPATTGAEFHYWFDPDDQAHYNQSVTYHDEPLIPVDIMYFLFIIGFVCFCISRFASPEQGNDLFAMLAIAPFFAATWATLQMDYIFSGVATMGVEPASQNTKHEIAMMTEHNVFHEYFLFAVFFLFAVLSVVNLIQILLRNAAREIKTGKISPEEDE